MDHGCAFGMEDYFVGLFFGSFCFYKFLYIVLIVTVMDVVVVVILGKVLFVFKFVFIVVFLFRNPYKLIWKSQFSV